MRVFVYGTLQRGEPSHAQLQGARFVASAVTEPTYELVSLGEYPALLEGGSSAVVGELYDVDSELLARLDLFEDVPELYERKVIRIAGHHAQGYVMRREQAHSAERIASGDWRRR
jgi:gamma-glutamylaminecyclotransferase